MRLIRGTSHRPSPRRDPGQGRLPAREKNQYTFYVCHAPEGRPATMTCFITIAGRRWPVVERANAWHNAFNHLQSCYERRETVIDAFFDLADAIITVRSLIRQAWTFYRWQGRPTRRP